MQSLLLTALLLASPALSLPSTVLHERDAPVWAANFGGSATSSTGAGFGRVQYQYEGQGQQNWDAGKTAGKDWSIPIVSHPQLGSALKIHLDAAYTDPSGNHSNDLPAMMRWEALPGTAATFNEGDEGFFRVDFVLGADYPVSTPNTWNLINQIHQGSGAGSPPVEFDVYNNMLYAQGEGVTGTPYKQPLGSMTAGTVYKLVYHVKFSATAANSLLEVWLNNVKVLGGATGYVPTVPTLNGGASYWKGATAYCKPGLAPFTVYQTNHRWGRSYAAVN